MKVIYENLLLNFSLSACFGKLLSDILGNFLGNSLFDLLRSALNEILSFLKSETGDLTNNLYNVKLACAYFCKNNVKLGLFLCSGSSSNSSACNSNGSGRNAEFLFNSLYKVCKFKYGE